MGMDPDQRAMLTMAATLERHTGTDQWGNETYDPPEDIPTFLTVDHCDYGVQDGHGSQDAVKVRRMEFVVDGADHAQVQDRWTFESTVGIVTHTDDITDTDGTLILQTISVDTTQRGRG